MVKPSTMPIEEVEVNKCQNILQRLVHRFNITQVFLLFIFQQPNLVVLLYTPTLSQ